MKKKRRRGPSLGTTVGFHTSITRRGPRGALADMTFDYDDQERVTLASGIDESGPRWMNP
jgi:hypothetical protein